MAAAPGSSRSAAFRKRDFRLLILATAVTNLVMPAHFMSLTFWAIDTFPGQKVVLTGLIVAVRGTGMLSSGLVGGAIADRFERRKVLLACESSLCLVTALIALCMLTMPFGHATVVPVFVLVFLFAVTMAIDAPSRTSSIPVIVGREHMGPALGVYNVALQITAPVSLPAVGFLIGRFGPDRVVAGSTLAWLVILPLIASLRYSSAGDTIPRAFRPGALFGDIRAGLAYSARHSVILPVMGMVFVLQVVGMPGVGMLGPVWMTDILGLSRAQFGLIAMLWGVGAFAGSLFLASRPRLAARGTTLAALVMMFGVSGIVFGHSRFVPLTAAANLGLGIAMAGMMLSSAAIAQSHAPDAMRGRVMGLFPLMMGLSMLNVGPVSAAGQVAGLPVVVPTLEWLALALAVLIVFFSPALRRAGTDREEGPPPAPVSEAPVAAEASAAH